MDNFEEWGAAEVNSGSPVGITIVLVIFSILICVALVVLVAIVTVFTISVPTGLLLVFGVPSAYVAYKYKSIGEVV